MPAEFLAKLRRGKHATQPTIPQEEERLPLRAIHHYGRILSLESNSLHWPANKPSNDIKIAWHHEQIASASQVEIEEMLASLKPRQRRS